jgi:hypothetical protein
MPGDRELLRLQEAERAARQRFDTMTRNIRDADVLRHAKDLWLEAEAATFQYMEVAGRGRRNG